MHAHRGFTIIELLITVTIIGVLAVIAIPLYQNYSAKAQASEASNLLSGLKTPLANLIVENGVVIACTTGAYPGTILTGKYVSNITFTPVGTTSCIIEATYGAGSPLIIGKKISLTYSTSTGQWVCNSDLPIEIKPKSCT